MAGLTGETSPAGAAPPALRPLRIGELLDVAIKVYRGHAGPLLRIGLVVILPVQLIGTVIAAATWPDGLTPLDNTLGTTGAETNADEVEAYAVGQVIVGVLAGLSTLLATAASVKAVSDAYMGGLPDWRESVGRALRKLPALLWLAICCSVVLVISAIALLIPAIWLSVACALAFPILMVEGVGGFKAIERGRVLMRKRWWPTAGAIFLGYMLASILSGIFGFLLGLLFFTAASDSGTAYAAANGLATAAATVATTPFQAAIMTLAYYDLRVRKEGLDLELLAERIGAPQGEGEPLFQTEGPRYDSAEPPFWPPPPDWQPPPGWVPRPPGSSD